MGQDQSKINGDLGKSPSQVKPSSQVSSSGSPGKPTTASQGGLLSDTVTQRQGPAALPPQFGRYRVIKKLGHGGMGTVYLVENTELEREEALKVPHFSDGDGQEVRERFLREAKSAAKVDHTGVCQIYDTGVLDGIYYLTMRFLKGRPLSDYTGAAQPVRKSVEIVVKLAQALDAAHAKGVIHRDLKPNNVMMVGGTAPVVMDFGLAKQIRQPDQQITRAGSALGTPAYMPPEQVMGELDQMGPASDIYSLCVILYQLMTGRLPFAGATEGVIYGQILHTEPPPPSTLVPGLNPALDEICRKAMSKSPADRYPSMKAFATALADCLRATPATEAGANLQPTTVDKAAVFQAATIAPARRIDDENGIFQAATVVPQSKRSLSETLPKAPPPSVVRSSKGTSKSAKKPRKKDNKSQNDNRLLIGLAVGVAVVLLMLAGGGLWAVSILRVKTADGILVVEVNEPNPEVYVDGEKVTVTWENGGRKAEVGVKSGTRKVEVKKDGFTANGETVTLSDGERKVLTARLEPIPNLQAPPVVENGTPPNGGQAMPSDPNLKPDTGVGSEVGEVVAVIGKPESNVPEKIKQPPTDPNAVRGADIDRGKSIRASTDPTEIAEIVGEVAPGFTARIPVIPGGVALIEEHFGRKRVLSTHPLDAVRPCILTSTVDIPANTKTWLTFDASHSAAGDWQVNVLANGEPLYSSPVGPTTVKNGWMSVSVELTRFAGQTIVLELHNKATGFSHEWAWWDKIRIIAGKTNQAGQSQPKPDGEIGRKAGKPEQSPPAPPDVVRTSPPPLDCTKGADPEVIKQAQVAWATYLGRNVEEDVKIADGVTMTFVLVPPGKFLMGSPENEMGKGGRYHNETVHEVTLTEPFDVSKYEVTQAQYQALTGQVPSLFKGPDLPVEQVTWKEADAFGRNLTQKLSDGHVYRLATEAEWEYSCRGGRPISLQFGVGDGRTLTKRDANFDNVLGQTCKVGSYPPNTLGLCDMHGNVWEWCADWNELYPNGPATNPLRTVGGPFRVARGGCHNEPAPECRSALRQGSPEDRRDCWMGFRLARKIPAEILNGSAAVAPPPSPPAEESAVSSEEGTRAGEERNDNVLKLKFCWCPPGSIPGFWMGKYEVTQAAWASLMGSMPSHKMSKGEGDRHPIYFISLEDASNFCKKLTEVERDEGRLSAEWEYRLPTEVEWEYACRAGTKTATAFGDKLSSLQANFNGDLPHNSGLKGPNLQKSVPVGSYRPNAWGLYDMHGNVKEFTTTSGRVRGGSWYDSGRNCCSEIFIPEPPTASESIGFRVALVPLEELNSARRKAAVPGNSTKTTAGASSQAAVGIRSEMGPQDLAPFNKETDDESSIGSENVSESENLATQESAQKAGGSLENSVDLYRKQADRAKQELLKDFEKATNRFARADSKQSVDVLKWGDFLAAERKSFEDNALLPWSAPMRPSTAKYLKSINKAASQLHRDYMLAIEKQRVSKNEAETNRLRAEVMRVSAPFVVGSWRHHVGDSDNGVVKVLSNGAISEPESDNRWTLDNAGRLVLLWRDPKAPNGVWVDTCELSPDGKTYTGRNNNNTPITGYTTTD